MCFQFQYTAGVNIEWLENKQREIGDTVARVEELQKELEEFEDKALVSCIVKILYRNDPNFSDK